MFAVVGQFFQYQPNDFTVSGGATKFTFPNENTLERDPDVMLLPRKQLTPEHPVAPRLIVEVSVHDESFAGSRRTYTRYFDGEPLLRALFLLKFFDRQMDGTLASAALLYRRDANEAPFVADFVSFGSAPLQIDREWLDTVQGQYRDLSGAAARLGNVRAIVTVPAVDLYFGTNIVVRAGVNARPDLVIDLWRVFNAFMDFE